MIDEKDREVTKLLMDMEVAITSLIEDHGWDVEEVQEKVDEYIESVQYAD